MSGANRPTLAYPVLLRPDPQHRGEAVGIEDRYGQGAVLLHVENEIQPAIFTEARTRALSEASRLLLPSVEVPLEEIELQPGIDEAGVRQDHAHRDQ